jgi:leucyl-tRNA synthetase
MQPKEKEDYNPKNIETKWADKWEEDKLYAVGTDTKKPKYYILDMFPYPSGDGLHIGHPKGYIATDILSRIKRMQGYNVLHPMGWDAYGLPAEQYAIKNKVHPRVAVDKNVLRFKEQLNKLGFTYDWDKEINTTDPKFYKWTQWIFKQMYKKGLCYESNEPINWCPSCKTGLANEDLEDGKCERCGSVVEKKPIRQWVVRITEYAEKLLGGLDDLDWKENVKEMQRNWIGKSEGAEIEFKITNGSTFTIFTTRPDTLFGCTYCVFAPENKLVQDYLKNNLISNKEEVENYILASKTKTEIERTAEGKEKTGVKLEGIFAINPANQKQIPVYIADYVLGNYGTGAIMAVPAHDERDYEFAKKYEIEIIEVISGQKKETEMVYTDSGQLINSDKFDGMESEEAKKKITEFVNGKMVTKYKLRDWVFARQRYWGEPFPIVYDANHKPYLVADSELPVLLPEVEKYEPTGDGESPLKNIIEWVEVKGEINSDGEFVSNHNGTTFYRETNTMPQWAGSSWYWLRFMDPHNENAFVGRDAEKYWGQVDFYVGGAEHATRHLIYGRFWQLFLYDIGAVSHKEPFKKLINVGLIMAEDGRKMSKRWGNVINPDDIVAQFGADTLRMYEMFIGPFQDSAAWNTKGLIGPRRFIERVWNLQYMLSTANTSNGELETVLNQTIKKVTEDYSNLQFNTAISQMMIFVNAVEKFNNITKENFEILLKLLAPVCPFFTEELWESIGNKDSIHTSLWPEYDENKIIDKKVKIAVQVNGKLRDVFETDTDSSDETLTKLAKDTEGYKKWVTDQVPKKIIIVKNKIVNIII